MLRLMAQAVARAYLGGRAGELTALGLGNACLIAAFSEELRDARKLKEEAPKPGDAEKLGDAAATRRLRDARSALMVPVSADKTVSEAERTPSEETVRAVFERIAADPFTQFLRQVESNDQSHAGVERIAHQR